LTAAPASSAPTPALVSTLRARSWSGQISKNVLWPYVPPPWEMLLVPTCQARPTARSGKPVDGTTAGASPAGWPAPGLLAVDARPITQLKTRVAELVLHTRNQPPAGVADRGNCHGFKTRAGPPATPAWPARSAGHHLLRKEERPLQSERAEDEPPEGRLKNLASQHLDQPTEQGKSGVAVGVHRADRSQLLHVRQLADVARQRIVAAPGIGKVIANPSRGVGHEMAAVTVAATRGSASCKSAGTPAAVDRAPGGPGPPAASPPSR